MQTPLKTVFDFLNENNGKMSTGEVCKYLYSKNDEYRKLIKSVGGIRKLINRTSSIEFVMPDCGGNNYLQLVGNGTGPAFDSDKLGTRYGVGKIIEKSNDEDAYTIEIWDRKSVRTSWKNSLRPVMDNGQPRLELVPPQRILVKIDVDKGKIAEESIEKIDELHLLIMCVTLQLTLI